MAEKAAALVEDWAEEDMSELNEKKKAFQFSAMAIVLQELVEMDRNHEKALSRIALVENVLRHSLTPQHPGNDISKVAGASQVALRVATINSSHPPAAPASETLLKCWYTNTKRREATEHAVKAFIPIVERFNACTSQSKLDSAYEDFEDSVKKPRLTSYHRPPRYKTF